MSWEVTGQCPKCGTDLLDSAKFCMRCGYTVEEDAPEEKAEDNEVSPMEKLGLAQEEEKEEKKIEEPEISEERKEETEIVEEKKEVDVDELDISFEELKPLAEEKTPKAEKSAKEVLAELSKSSALETKFAPDSGPEAKTAEVIEPKPEIKEETIIPKPIIEESKEVIPEIKEEVIPKPVIKEPKEVIPETKEEKKEREELEISKMEERMQDETINKCLKCGTPMPHESKFCINCGVRIAKPKCPKCGASNKFDAKFCFDCGTHLFTKCPACETDITDDSKFCSHCGANLHPECSNCKAELPAGSLFCTKCGKKVD